MAINNNVPEQNHNIELKYDIHACFLQCVHAV